jgi:hypothetical protein
MKKLALISTLIASMFVTANADEVKETTVTAKEDLAKLSQKMNNPMADLWMLWTQHDVTSLQTADGDSYISHSTKFQPVMSFDATENYNLILRPNFQFQSIEAPGLERENGMGDLGVLAALGTKTPVNGWILGGGVSAIMPTAEETYLSSTGADQFAAGPNFVGLKLGKKYTYGVVAQHFEGMGDSELVDENGKEEDMSLTDIQYIWRYRVSPTLQIGMAPNITIDWTKEGSDRFTIPVGIGFDYMTRIGNTPVRLAVEAYHYVEQADEFGPDWGLRFFFIPVVENPFK